MHAMVKTVVAVTTVVSGMGPLMLGRPLRKLPSPVGVGTSVGTMRTSGP